MSLIYESIRTILGDVDTFLQETLKKENLSKSSKEQRQCLIDKIVKIWEEYPQLAPSHKNKPDVGDESTRTGGSSTTDDGEDPYSDQKFPDLAAGDIKYEIVSGFLEKKQKKGLLLTGKFQKRWCAIKDDCMYYFESKKDKKQKGAFCLSGYTFQTCPDMVKEASKKELCFEVVCQGRRAFQFMAQNQEDFDKWKSAIKKVTATPTDYDDDEDNIYEPVDDPINEPIRPEPTEELHQGGTTQGEDDQDVYEDTVGPPQVDQLAYEDCSFDTPPPPAKRTIPSRPAPRTALGSKPLPPTPDVSPQPPLTPDRKTPREPPTPPKRENKPETTEPIKRKIVNPKEDFENFYYGKWDFCGGTENELTFKKSDMIHVISKEFDAKSWWVGELQGKYGLVPKLHLTPAYELTSA